MGLISRVSSRTYRERQKMFASRSLRDAFKSRNKLPFVQGSKRNPRNTDAPDFTLLRKITEPVLPPLALDDEKTKKNRELAKLEREHLFGRDFLLGKEFEVILKSVHENQDYAFENQIHTLANNLALNDTVYTHRYAKHVRDNVFKNSHNPAYNALGKISWKSTDIVFSYDMKNLKKAMGVLKKNPTNFILLGGVANNVCMTVQQLEKAGKEKFDQGKLDQARAETIQILGAGIQGTYQILGQTISEFGSIIHRLSNEEIGKTSRYLGQHQNELVGLLSQMEQKDKE